MDELQVQLKLNDSKRGAFFVDDNGEQVAEMVIGISGNNLTVYHTEVNEKLRGTGISQSLLVSMVKYAREHELEVIPLCSFVTAQFKRHPELYKDIWNQNWHQ
jgi:predicted GNAT family acetyltransferase